MIKNPRELAQAIDFTLLKPDATQREIEQLCEQALTYSFFAVCVAPCYVETAGAILKNSQIKVCSVVGFPLGNTSVSIKIVEAMEALKHGAKELDMVINIGALRSGSDDYVKNEILNVSNVCQGAVLKVILETGALTREEIVRGARLILDSGTLWIKTSTGFNFPGATVENVRLLKRMIQDRGFIKASGGIRDLKTAQAMLRAGASRIGTSHGVAIMKQCLQRQGGARR